MFIKFRNMEKEGSSSGSSNPEKATCIPLVQRTKRKERYVNAMLIMTSVH